MKFYAYSVDDNHRIIATDTFMVYCTETKYQLTKAQYSEYNLLVYPVVKLYDKLYGLCIPMMEIEKVIDKDKINETIFNILYISTYNHTDPIYSCGYGSTGMPMEILVDDNDTILCTTSNGYVTKQFDSAKKCYAYITLYPSILNDVPLEKTKDSTIIQGSVAIRYRSQDTTNRLKITEHDFDIIHIREECICKEGIPNLMEDDINNDATI